MAYRIEIKSKYKDTRAQVRKERLEQNDIAKIDSVEIVDVYTIEADLTLEQQNRVVDILTNPVTQESLINKPQTPKNFDWAIEIGFLPGVTDNVAHTTKEGVEDLLNRKLSTTEGVYTSQITFISGYLTRDQVKQLAESMANKLIQRILIKSKEEFNKDNGMGIVIPRVKLTQKPTAGEVDILNATDEELTIIGKKGIVNKDGTRRGPLALSLTYMKTIRDYFKKQNRNPTDIELESIAQTWSEHCKHTIFADPMDEIKDGLYKEYIKAATNTIRKKKGNKDFCVSVFTDNSGIIKFNDKFHISHKAETHNSPSALDPFGGAITGIVGVNRDAMGVGLGAKPVINVYGYCFADPNEKSPLYKGSNFTQKMLPSRMIMDGIIEGVNVGGNCSGIPSPQGFKVFDQRYKGKPLVFVGTVGLIPVKSKGRDSHEKSAMPGDYVVVTGGRVGKDGIHGATFSSEAMDSGSPATAVQIGDPITQKKMSDAIIKEARDLGLYTSITDNGAGGISCSIAEMAKECGGCIVKLDDVPLKYPGLEPWETWISESQERMTLSVPKDKWKDFKDIMDRRGVEATIVGEFTNSKKCIVKYDGKTIMDIDMDFLHDGLPVRPMITTYTKPKHNEPTIPIKENLTKTLKDMMKRLNIASFEFISQQYDHEVQGGSVIKPLQGKGRVNGDASVTRPLLDSIKGIALSQGINPQYSDIDTYDMAACAIDTSIRNIVAVGADPKQVALMDNFCWCSSDDKERLGQLKAAAKACYDYAVAYEAPFISGKDSMFNDFKGYDKDGKAVKISVPPTLLVSSIAVMEDSTKAISLDVKQAGDLVYILGDTKDELGASEYFAYIGEKERKEKYVGNKIPKVDSVKNMKNYEAFSKAANKELIASAQSVHIGGLGVAIVKSAAAGKLGMNISLKEIGNDIRDDFKLFSESQGRILITIDRNKKEEFETLMKDTDLKLIGEVRNDNKLIIKGKENKIIVDTTADELLKSYKETFRGF